ncbi:MAG: Ni/Fe hydrogenase subunit alpha [Anaerolineae bacterium]|nr:Ni/Fe hydrogenase subunit alpha [Anaerolineae bacterium]
MAQRLTIDPITRLEGHGKIEIFLDDAGEVKDTYFQIPELRGFEVFCLGRPAEDMPRLTDRICGVCPEAHHMASAKALDMLFHVDPPAAAKKLRELLYMAFYVTDHTTHFYALGGPDFVVGPDAPASKRNVLGVIAAVGQEAGLRVLNTRKANHEVIRIIGGRAIHPVSALPGGMSKAISEEERQFIEKVAHDNIEFAQWSLSVFRQIVLKNPSYVDLIRSDGYTQHTHYMGLVDANNHVNFYDGMVRVIDPAGREFAKYAPQEYADHIAEHVEPYSYVKFPYLRKVGWKGFVDGPDSGLYTCTPMSRLNVADGMATPRAQEAYEQLFDALGGKPVHHVLAAHWARLVEMLYAAENMLILATDPEITSPDVRAIPTETPTVGIGTVEAPRGTLTHHYETDERGLITKVNLIVGTTNNSAPITLSIKKAASALIHDGKVNDGILNMVEMAFRCYDPCFSCATHSLPGQMPLEVKVYDAAGALIDRRAQYLP